MSASLRRLSTMLADEAAQVDALFGGRSSADVGDKVFSDSWPAAA